VKVGAISVILSGLARLNTNFLVPFASPVGAFRWLRHQTGLGKAASLAGRCYQLLYFLAIFDLIRI
jgi:hypothetical protein